MTAAAVGHLASAGLLACTAVALSANDQGDSVTRSLHFSWELSGSGWATCRIWDGSTKHQDIVSYCTNALADLLKGVTGLYGHHGIRRFSFDLEPAEARWILRRRNSDVHITIRRFPDMSTSFEAPDGKGTLVWTSMRPRTSLAHAVLMAAEKLQRTHGEDGYLQKWGRHAFPTTELEPFVTCIWQQMTVPSSTEPTAPHGPNRS
ncbi:hypothetical protein [Streptomyces erythrochromogenes]|uniref:hypothetical protein n=1 Tax=Streptomyces erythrochromogenes TaxID=285574 RepID=UPI0036931E89